MDPKLEASEKQVKFESATNDRNLELRPLIENVEPDKINVLKDEAKIIRVMGLLALTLTLDDRLVCFFYS